MKYSTILYYLNKRGESWAQRVVKKLHLQWKNLWLIFRQQPKWFYKLRVKYHPSPPTEGLKNILLKLNYTSIHSDSLKCGMSHAKGKRDHFVGQQNSGKYEANSIFIFAMFNGYTKMWKRGKRKNSHIILNILYILTQFFTFYTPFFTFCTFFSLILYKISYSILVHLFFTRSTLWMIHLNLRRYT